MGLVEVAKERTKITDLNNFGISTDPIANEFYGKTYNNDDQ
jgi:hypothetical protein